MDYSNTTLEKIMGKISLEPIDFTKLPNYEVIKRTVKALSEHNIESFVVKTKEEALNKIKELIPAGASVINGASVTLHEIGFIDYLKSGVHGWENLQEAILAEKDPSKQAILRKQTVLSEYYLGSVHALTETGELVIASNTGSQLPSIAATSSNVIFIAGIQKIVPTLADALIRVEEHVVPLEDKRIKGTGYAAGTQRNKTLIFHGENPYLGRKIRIILVKEALGF